MERYFKINEGTKAYAKFYDLLHFQEKWIQNKERIESIIKTEMDKNLGMSVIGLYMSNPPEELKSQFKKNPEKDGFYQAKVRSDVNKQWLALVEELGLYVPELHWIAEELKISRQLGNDGVYLITLYNWNDMYYFKGGTSSKGSGKCPEFATELKESEFLRAQLEYTEKREKEGKRI